MLALQNLHCWVHLQHLAGLVSLRPLHDAVNPPTGTLFYAIAYDTLYAPYGARQLAFGTLAPPASAVVAARPASFRGGLVANGSLAVERAGAWVTARIQPPCVGALCQHSLHGLQGGTAYQVFLVAVDRYGNADPAPAVAPLTTAPATAAPALLPATAPSDITDSSFGASVSTDAAGGVYYQLLAAKPGAVEPAGTAGVAPGQWARLDSLADSTGGRRRLAAGQGLVASRQLLEAGSAAVEPGSLVAPVCYPDNQTCTLAPAAVFSDAVADLAASFEPVASGCLAVPAAGAPAALPAFTGLQNNTLHLLLLASEDRGVPQPARLQPPVALAVRTVDLSAPQLACGFPLATNITATGFALSAMLTKPGASVFFVVLPAGGAGTPPSPLEVLQGRGPGGAAPAAAGNLTRWGHLPWEAAPAGEGAGDPRKLWEPVGRLPDGGNYTGFFVATLDGATPAPGSAVSSLRCLGGGAGQGWVSVAGAAASNGCLDA